MESENKKHNHNGHRNRMKTALLKDGAGKLDELDLLEMLLYYVVPRIDTRDIAKQLLDKFGGVEEILDADQGEISKISGLKDSAEVLFILLREVISRFGGIKHEVSLLEPEKMKKYLVGLYKDVTVETVYALYFKSNGDFAGKELVFRGDISSAKFSLRTVTEGVIRAGGSAVVLAHNHPSDILVPSEDDILSSKRISAHLAANDIDLLGHYIVGKKDAVEFFAIKYF